MDNKDITDKLIGEIVTVVVKHAGQKKFVERNGIVKFLEPRMFLNLKQGIEGIPFESFEPFCGVCEGIYLIKGKEGNILYQNDAVIEAYKKSSITEALDRQILREKGIFYLK